MTVKYFESCAGCGMQRRGLENACKEIGNTAQSVGISEVSPKALIAYAAIHEGNMLKEVIENDKENGTVEPEVMADLLTNKGIGQFEGTATRPEKIDWYKKNKGKAFEYMKLVGDADYISMNRGDMNKVEDLPEGLDIFFSSTPCTSVSVAGYNAGMEKGSGTPSALAWDVSRLIASTKNKPKVVIFENVKGMVSGKNLDQFNSLVDEIKSLGYNTYWKVLNAKWFGVPQNRERIFFVAIRQDIDTGTFAFPVEFDSGIRLRDILQDHVADKYYIDNEKARKLIEDLKSKNKINELDDGSNTVLIKKNGTEYGKKIDNASTLLARDWKGMNTYGTNCVIEKNESKFLGNIYGENNHSGRARAVWDKNGLAPTIKANSGGNSQPMILNEIHKVGSLHSIDGSWADPQIDRVYGTDGIAPALNTCGGGRREPKVVVNEIRKIGQISSDGSQNGTVVDEEVIYPTISAGTHGWCNPYTKIAVPVLTPDRLNKRQNGRRFKTDGEPAFTLTSVDRHGVMIDGNEDHHIYCEEEGFDIAIRKLTPEECFVLMGMTVDDCKKCREYGLTDTDLYKIAGNGLVTNCVQYIVEHLYKALVDSSYVTTDEKMLGAATKETA